MNDISKSHHPPTGNVNHQWHEIVASKGWVRLQLGEVWRCRELLFFLAWRDISVRYKQTILGAAWAILQPLMTMCVFTLFFGTLAKIGSDGAPYAIWSYCGLVLWQYFAYVLDNGASSLVRNEKMLKKVYFPRLILPLSSAVDGLVDFAIAFGLLLLMMLWWGIFPTWKIALALPMVALAATVAVGAGLWLSALNVRYRDVRYTLPFLMQFWLFVSPIAYPASMVPEYKTIAGVELPLRALYGLNPMVGVVEGFRWAMLGTNVELGATFVVSLAVTAAVLIGGLFYFRRMERSFADIL